MHYRNDPNVFGDASWDKVLLKGPPQFIPCVADMETIREAAERVSEAATQPMNPILEVIHRHVMEAHAEVFDLWLRTPNRHVGGMTPTEAITAGKTHLIPRPITRLEFQGEAGKESVTVILEDCPLPEPPEV